MKKVMLQNEQEQTTHRIYEFALKLTNYKKKATPVTKDMSIKRAISLIHLILIICVFSGCSGLKKLNNALTHPDNVTKLKISGDRIDSLPKEIGKLTNLKKLYLFNNNLRHIPEEIGNLENLEILVISSNELTELPGSIGNLKKLKKISLKHNSIKHLPEEIGDLTNLKELYLEYNLIESLPSSIGNLKNLRFLYLNDNKLIEIPAEIGKLGHLNYLVIGKNHLQFLPPEIGNLSGLIELNVAFCGPMVEIPESIRYCKRLEYLYIDKSLLLPYSINSVNPRLRVIVLQTGVQSLRPSGY